MRNIKAIFWKQVKETFKNKTILIQFIMFPLMEIIMENAVVMQDMPEHFFTKLFAVMYIGMAPLISMTAVLSEEKEDCTLKVLMMSDVKPVEYLLGTGSYIWTACMAGALVFAVVGELKGSNFLAFMLIMSVGIIASLFVGAAIGTWSRNQMMATSLSVPVMMVFSFLPMLSMFNETIQKAAKFTYSEQISILINQLGQETAGFENIIVILLNVLVAFVCFVCAYRRCGLA